MSVNDNLLGLYERHRGKVSDRWMAYLLAYDDLLADRRLQELNLLEIGIQNGGSLEIWAEYFPRARLIVGCDISPACAALRYDDPRIQVVVGDICTAETGQKIATLAPSWDLIIDDGSHRSSHIVTTFARYFPRLQAGGTFIAEDLHCSYWQKFEGGLSDPFSSVAFFKALIDIVNFEHWGTAATRTQYLARFARHYHCQFDESVLAQIHAVEFTNSRCVIHKRAADDNLLGERQVVGTTARVVPGVQKFAGSLSVPQDQSSNPWSATRHYDFPYVADPLQPPPNPVVAALRWRFNRVRRLARNWLTRRQNKR